MVASVFFILAQALAAQAVPPGSETGAMAVANATALHAKMDGNRDGYVTPAEMAAFIIKSMNGLPIPGTDTAHPLPPLSAALFEAGDTDQDGRISRAEAIAAARKDFARQDTNHDGVVTPEERMAFLQRVIKDGMTPEGVPLLPHRMRQ